MPARSQAQLKYIYAMRNKYRSKSRAPKKMKWVFDNEWTDGVKMKELPEKVAETIVETYRKMLKHRKTKLAENGELNMKLKKILKEDISKFTEDPMNNITRDDKKAFLEAVKNYNKYSKSIYREYNLKEVSKNISSLAKIAEHLTLKETNDWFDALTVKRDMKTLNEAVKLFEKTSLDMYNLQHRLESLYEEIGSKLSKYYDISDQDVEQTNNDIVSDQKCNKTEQTVNLHTKQPGQAVEFNPNEINEYNSNKTKYTKGIITETNIFGYWIRTKDQKAIFVNKHDIK